jgi:hypothetical protein
MNTRMLSRRGAEDERESMIVYNSGQYDQLIENTLDYNPTIPIFPLTDVPSVRDRSRRGLRALIALKT